MVVILTFQVQQPHVPNGSHTGLCSTNGLLDGSAVFPYCVLEDKIGVVAQLVEYLPGMSEALGTTPGTSETLRSGAYP